MISATSVENAPFHKTLCAALEALLKARPGRRMRSGECHALLAQEPRHQMPDGRPRYTEGQVRSALYWMANNRESVKMVLSGGKVREYWAIAQEE